MNKLWILSVVFLVACIFALIRREALRRAVLISLGLLVGPGGISLSLKSTIRCGTT
jgi:hypothetical protein